MTAAVLCFSVDDGHPLDMRMADLLIKRGVQASFFVPSRNSEGQPVLPPSALRDLSGKFEIGSHTLEHRYLNRLDMHEALRQITEGKRALQDTLGKPVHGFCYPGGKYRALHCGMVQAAGFRYARTTQNLRLDVECSPLELPTTLQFYPHPRALLIATTLAAPVADAGVAAARAALAGPAAQAVRMDRASRRHISSVVPQSGYRTSRSVAGAGSLPRRGRRMDTLRTQAE
jgi:peptidoglycan/xylan/chitin deacetylase (PgdA/CDA1 family)